MSDIDWDAIERNQRAQRRPPVVYIQRECPLCGKVIREGAYSGHSGNWKKHARACEKRQESRP